MRKNYVRCFGLRMSVKIAFPGNMRGTDDCLVFQKILHPLLYFSVANGYTGESNAQNEEINTNTFADRCV